MAASCIHSMIPFSEDGAHLDASVLCNRRFVRIAHGYLCIDHYRAQQRAMPEIPKKPKYFQFDDDEVLADITRTEDKAIRTGIVDRVWHAGNVIRFWRES